MEAPSTRPMRGNRARDDGRLRGRCRRRFASRGTGGRLDPTISPKVVLDPFRIHFFGLRTHGNSPVRRSWPQRGSRPVPSGRRWALAGVFGRSSPPPRRVRRSCPEGSWNSIRRLARPHGKGERRIGPRRRKGGRRPSTPPRGRRRRRDDGRTPHPLTTRPARAGTVDRRRRSMRATE